MVKVYIKLFGTDFNDIRNINPLTINKGGFNLELQKTSDSKLVLQSKTVGSKPILSIELFRRAAGANQKNLKITSFNVFKFNIENGGYVIPKNSVITGTNAENRGKILLAGTSVETQKNLLCLVLDVETTDNAVAFINTTDFFMAFSHYSPSGISPGQFETKALLLDSKPEINLSFGNYEKFITVNNKNMGANMADDQISFVLNRNLGTETNPNDKNNAPQIYQANLTNNVVDMPGNNLPNAVNITDTTIINAIETAINQTVTEQTEELKFITTMQEMNGSDLKEIKKLESYTINVKEGTKLNNIFTNYKTSIARTKKTFLQYLKDSYGIDVSYKTTALEYSGLQANTTKYYDLSEANITEKTLGAENDFYVINPTTTFLKEDATQPTYTQYKVYLVENIAAFSSIIQSTGVSSSQKITDISALTTDLKKLIYCEEEKNDVITGVTQYIKLDGSVGTVSETLLNEYSISNDLNVNNVVNDYTNKATPTQSFNKYLQGLTECGGNKCKRPTDFKYTTQTSGTTERVYYNLKTGKQANIPNDYDKTFYVLIPESGSDKYYSYKTILIKDINAFSLIINGNTTTTKADFDNYLKTKIYFETDSTNVIMSDNAQYLDLTGAINIYNSSTKQYITTKQNGTDNIETLFQEYEIDSQIDFTKTVSNYFNSNSKNFNEFSNEDSKKD